MIERAVAVVGDVHGCARELDTLLREVEQRPPSRHVVFVGDLADRGPDSAGVLARVEQLVASGRATLIRGNHDDKLLKIIDDPGGPYGADRRQTLRHLRAADAASPGMLQRARLLLDGAVEAVEWDDPARAQRILITHAGVPARLARSVLTRGWHATRERDPAHFDRQAVYAGGPGKDGTAIPVDGLVQVHGHTPTGLSPDPDAAVVNIDTGACFGGFLSAWLWPERELVQIAAEREYRSPPPNLRSTAVLATDGA